MKELKAKEREEKRLARLALQESKRMKKEKPEFAGNMGGFGPGGEMRMNMYGNAPIPIRHPGDFQEQRFPATPRLQVCWFFLVIGEVKQTSGVIDGG